jgi:hypothetical protein
MPPHVPVPQSCPASNSRHASVRSHWRAALALALIAATASAQQNNVVEKMAANEVAARQQRSHFFFVAQERSVRTGGHLWKENVVETNDGPLHRVIAIDNKPLTPAEAAVEQRRIDYLVAHPDQLRRENQAHKDDETRATQLMQMLSTAYVLTPNGEINGCTRFTFQPRPEFRPSSYQERVAHELAGTVSVKQPEDRLCTLEATILHPVEFGFGILGRVDEGGHFSLVRKQIDAKNWKTDRFSVHVNGRILMLKTLAQDQDTVRSDIRIVPQNLTLAEAAQLIRQ